MPYGVTGPLGEPCTDAQAYEPDRVCRSLDDPEVSRLSAPPGSAADAGSKHTGRVSPRRPISV